MVNYLTKPFYQDLLPGSAIEHVLVRIPISSRLNRASATKTLDLGSIPGQVKLKTIKIDIHSFRADVQD